MSFLRESFPIVTTASYAEETENGTQNFTQASGDLDVYTEGNQTELESLLAYKAALVIFKACPPVILILGTFGNVMILVTLRHLSLGGSSRSMSTFFVALAVSDLLILYVILLPNWLDYTFDINVYLLHNAICKLHMYAVYLVGMTSSWFLVCMTMQRVTSVVWPHKVGLLCSKRKTVLTAVVVTLLLMGFNSHLLHVFALEDYQEEDNSTTPYCDYSQQASEDLVHYDTYIFPWIDLVMASFLPALLLFVGNTVLILTVARSTRTGRRLSVGHGAQASREKAASSLTVTLISVSLAYVLLTLPVCVCILVSAYVDWDSVDVYWEARFELAWAVSHTMFLSNAAVNFYVYCLTGAKFRRQCWRLLLCCCKARAARSPATSAASLSISMASTGVTSAEEPASQAERSSVSSF